MNHIHFLGIAGIGVSALAQVAQARGAKVSGSDPNADPDTNPAIRRLQDGGARLFTTHDAANLADDVTLVVASAAVADTNPELQAAREREIRIVSRAEYLGELMTQHQGVTIAVAGTHGKTTTTAMIGVMLQEAGLNPTVFVGGEVPQLGGNVRIGSATGPFVAEACEAYDSFLSLKPDIAVITNIEADHLDHYGDLEGVRQSFSRFLQNVNPNGDIIVCADDPILDTMRDEISDLMPYLVYGFDKAGSGSRAANVVWQPTPAFDWYSGNSFQARVTLNVPGRHNVLNALAALALHTSFQQSRLKYAVRKEAFVRGIEAFRGVERRQEVLGEIPTGAGGSVLVMDDYAHHPTEIRATLDALRSAYPKRRLVAVFQPHLYSRTRDFLPDFAASLAQADALFVTDIYPAREQPIAGVNAHDIVTQARTLRPALPAEYVADKDALPPRLRALAQPNDLVVFLGAGDIREPGEALVRLLQSEAGPL